jgi:hypothetical protein
MRALPLVLAALALAGCPTPSVDDDDSGSTPAPELPDRVDLRVTVTLDGAPRGGVTVGQGGLPDRWTTGDDGVAEVTVDRTLDAEHWIFASHPDARIGAAEVDEEAPATPLTIALTSFDRSDNPEFTFRDPGEPTRRETTAQCAHCHVTMVTDWIGSAHRDAARDPQVHDLYAGTASGAGDETSCADRGGAWLVGPLPGGGDGARCYLGDGVLPALNGCGETPCAEPTAFGACADCHAPGIDGALGGRDLLEAEGHAFDYGVHCDVCHRVEDVDLEAPAGSAGALKMLRPSEPPALGYAWQPLTFGPYDDVPSVVMGAVQRDHFADARLCAGCHQHRQEALVPGGAVDAERWPTGTLPIHTTWQEWIEGPLSPSVPCQVCHMPPSEGVGNSADLTLFNLEPGLVAGWERPATAVRRHTFEGPGDGIDGLLPLAASLDLVTSLQEGALSVTATVRNIGAGHAIPTGEPLRAMLLLVEAACEDEPLAATGGFALSDLAGALARKEAGEDWSRWPGAAPGQVVRVVRRSGGWHDDGGFGPFGDGTFTPEQKGMPVEEVVGTVTIASMDGDVATFDGPLPAGDVAWLGEPAEPTPGSPVDALAGAPGHAFARVLVGADGRRNVPHFLAVDVASDNRLLPAAAWTGTWTFAAAGCAEPVAQATLLYRRWPRELAAERGWAPVDVIVLRATR